MNRLLFRANLYLIAGCVLACLSCSKLTNVDVSGTYSRTIGDVVDKIVLETNGSFHQTVTFEGEDWTRTGSWKLNGGTVEFDWFLLPLDEDTGKKVIPPKLVSTEVLWVERGKLTKNPELPAWLKQN